MKPVKAEIRGLAASSGIALGYAHLLERDKVALSKRRVHQSEVEFELSRFKSALQQAREHLWIQLTTKISLAVKAAFKEVRNIDQEWKITEGPIGTGLTGAPGLPSGTDTTIDAILVTEGERPGQFNEEEKRDLFIRLRANYPNVLKEEIETSIQNFDNWRVRGVVLYYGSQANCLWELTSVGGFLIVLINTEHEFYKRVISPLRFKNIEMAVASIELFISSLAWEEHSHFSTDEKKKDIVEAFRNYAGLHLNSYLKDNDIIIDEDQLVGPNNGESEHKEPAE